MINVDAIFVVSLLDRCDRRVLLREQLNKCKVNWKTWLATKDENGIKGLQESMKGLFEHIIFKDFKTVLILEDDADIIVANPVELINKCISQLPPDFDLLQLGANVVRQPEPYSENLLKVSYTHSTHAIIYSRSGIEKAMAILDYETHYDALIHQHIQPDGKCFCSNPMIINQRDGYSDIENKTTYYGTMMKRKFEKYIK